MEPISYKGYVIVKETEPWRLKASINFYFHPEGEGASDCFNNGFETIEEAKLAIDEVIQDELDSLERQERYIRSQMIPTLWSGEMMKEWETKLDNVRRESIALWNQYKAA
jgi:hypothetical protein